MLRMTMTMTALPLTIPAGALPAAGPDAVPAPDGFPSARLFKVPDIAPPFDGEPAPEGRAGITNSAPRVPRPRTAGALAPAPRAGAPAGPGDWPARFARLLTEVLSGLRPARQLTPWMTRRACFALRALAPVFSTGQRPRVLRVLASQPSPAVVEMSVVVGLGTRTRALAVRLERAAAAGQPGRWLCTDIEAARPRPGQVSAPGPAAGRGQQDRGRQEA
jgi:hypothetical protein